VMKTKHKNEIGSQKLVSRAHVKATMASSQEILRFYKRPTTMTSAGKHARSFDGLPNEVAELVRIIQQVLLYDVVAAEFYGFAIPEERWNEIHIRPMEKMLDRLFALDKRNLSVARPLNKRLVGRCRQFVLFLIAMLRAKGIPARARCGFGAYFNPRYFEDHWICEYWNAAEARWIFVDAQFDDVWRRKLNIKHDILDVPRDQFLVAADAWNRCRAGEGDASKFGIDFAGLRGLWFIAGSLVRDVAALNKAEMLPWDFWGAQPRPGDSLGAEQIAFFDQLAAITHAPDASFSKLRDCYGTDDRLRVPATVFNSILNRPELVRGDLQ
jgi:Transglutaminase-like superfamily